MKNTKPQLVGGKVVLILCRAQHHFSSTWEESIGAALAAAAIIMLGGLYCLMYCTRDKANSGKEMEC